MRIGILTGGGDVPGLNPSIKSVVTRVADGGHEDEMLRRLDPAMLQSPPGRPKRRRAKQEVYARYPDTMARAKMVRTDRYKMVVRLRGGNELYDLEQDPDEMVKLYRPTGCAHCSGTGYKGRRAVAELLKLDDGLRDLIAARAPMSEIKAAAKARGMDVVIIDHHQVPELLPDAALEIGCHEQTVVRESAHRCDELGCPVDIAAEDTETADSKLLDFTFKPAALIAEIIPRAVGDVRHDEARGPLSDVHGHLLATRMRVPACGAGGSSAAAGRRLLEPDADLPKHRARPRTRGGRDVTGTAAERLVREHREPHRLLGVGVNTDVRRTPHRDRCERIGERRHHLGGRFGKLPVSGQKIFNPSKHRLLPG